MGYLSFGYSYPDSFSNFSKQFFGVNCINGKKTERSQT
nr:MAG TPA: hypothetical protein [Caudoviricetes sp.]